MHSTLYHDRNWTVHKFRVVSVMLPSFAQKLIIPFYASDKSLRFDMATTIKMLSECLQQTLHTYQISWWHLPSSIDYLALTSRVGDGHINVTRLFL